MYENDYMYAIERNDEYLAHYGIRGMKWGVRKAIASGNGRRLGRQYAKAQKKLAKLEKRAASGKKYARRAAMLGAGAAAAGGLAIAGTQGVGNLVGHAGRVAGAAQKHLGVGAGALGGLMMKSRNAKVRRAGIKVMGAGTTMQKTAGATRRGVVDAGEAVKKWGHGTSIGQGAATKYAQLENRAALRGITDVAEARKLRSSAMKNISDKRAAAITRGPSNNAIARAGAAAIGAGLAGAAGYNAYRAATTKRAAKKAAQFRSEMNKAFKGTQYDTSRNRQGKKRRRR